MAEAIRAAGAEGGRMIDRDDVHWYRDAIVYQIHLKAFFDSNGDGIGDFAGAIEKLDYVRDLGVSAIWLLPFYESPLRDDGYDIADYRKVDARYGGMAEFKRFLREAHARGLRVITELVINHTSDQHPWFQRARQAKAGSAERDYYVWSDTDDKYDGTRIIFHDTEPSNWTWDVMAGAYYWHRFHSHQPDLNFENPKVLNEILSVMHFWLEAGVDGLRLDAVPYLREREGTNNENLPETHELLRRIRAEVDSRYADRMLLAEANQRPEDVREYFGHGDECHMAFHFPLMPRMYMALAQEDRHPITDILRQMPEIPDGCQWAIFLRNHDELTLEMVTDQERDELWRFYAGDRRMRLNHGIRRRLAPLMENDRRKVKLMNSLLLSMPGTPILYYGDEIGMGDNVHLSDRDGVRTPMQWTRDMNGGFSPADPAKLDPPPIVDPIWGYEAVNVEAQQRDPSSLLHWTRRMLAVRSNQRAFGLGTLTFLDPANRAVLAYIRQFETETVLCVANLSRAPQEVELDLREWRGRAPRNMTGRDRFPPIGDVPYPLTMAGHGFHWFSLEGVRRAAP
jgi:maltose alpha-D-glucosyltransferase/alpha-amylase